MKKYSLWLWLFGVVGFVSVSLGLVVFGIRNEKEENTHEYTTMTVTGKYVENGYAGFYVYKDTAYIILSEDSEGNEIQTYVTLSVYNNYEVGDLIFYCKNHNKLKDFE